MKPISDPDLLLATIAREGTTVLYRKGQALFSQGAVLFGRLDFAGLLRVSSGVRRIEKLR